MNCETQSYTVLVTGANGFIGQRMLHVLHARGIRTIGLGRSAPRAGSNCPADDWIVADIAACTPIIVPACVDAIIHLAGKAHALSEVAQDNIEYFRINTEGTRHMLEAAQRTCVRSFLYFSTVKAARENPAQVDTGPMDESWSAEPDTPYGRSKREAEKLVLGGGYVPHPIVLRPCLVYGPSPKGNLEKMIDAVSRGRFPPLPEVNNRRSMVHIDDVIFAALLATEMPTAAAGNIYIVADNQPFSTRQLYEWICLECERPVRHWAMPLWILRLLGHVGAGIGRLRGRRFMFDTDAFEKLTGSAWYSSAKLQRELGWRPTHTLQESLHEIVVRHRS